MNLRCIQGSLYNSTEAWVLNTEHAFLAHRAQLSHHEMPGTPVMGHELITVSLNTKFSALTES